MAFSCVLLGNETLTLECGKQLLDAGHRIDAIVSHRAELVAWAADNDLTLFPSVAALRDAAVTTDWLLSIANLDMIPRDVLALASHGAINFHDGPLPRYAGLNAPVWSIAAGEETHGVTWHLMEEGADRGDILMQRTFAIAPDETAFTLNAKCFAAGIESFPDLLVQIEADLPDRRPQDFAERSYFGRAHVPRAAGRVDFSDTAIEIQRLVRALDHGEYDNPVASPWIMSSEGPVVVSGALPADRKGAQGEILAVTGTEVIIACRGGAIQFTGLRDPMGRVLDPATRFVPGQRLETGTPDHLLSQAASSAGEQEVFWRRAFEDYRPAQWLTNPCGEGTTDVPIATGDHEPDLIHAAFAALAARLSGGDATDIALSTGADSDVLTRWVPVRFDPEGGWARASQGFAKALATARERTPFAFDLPARIAALASRHQPAAAIGGDAPVQGSALTLCLRDGQAVLLGDDSRIAPHETRRIAARLAHLLAHLDQLSPDAMPDTLPSLPEDERACVIEEFNATETAYPAGTCIHHAFEAQAARSPDATALVFNDRAFSFAELNARANRVAHVLIGLGVAPGQPVGLHLQRTDALVVGALAILKAGGAYVPLDPGYPADRLAFYASDSKTRVIVSESALTADLVPQGVERLLIDTDPRIMSAPPANPDVPVTSQDLAYLIYTSGSTGTPKGVMVEHGNVVNFFTGMDDRIPHDADSAWLAVTSLSFDISVLELFWTLSRGIRVVLLGEEKLVADGATEVSPDPSGMNFSLFFWGNDDGVGRDKYTLLLDGARFADDNGFQAVWTPERHFHAFGGLYPNPSVTGAAVAAVTRNIAVRAGSVVAPLHHPARIAEEWAVIDNLTNGRTGLAIASGWHPDDFVLRPENAPPKNKEAVFDAIRDLRRLWSGQPLEMTRADGTKIEKLTQPRPVSKDLELWLTIAGNPDAWRQAGEAGVNVLTHLLGQSMEDVAERIAMYHEALRASGRDPKDFKVTLMLHTCLAETREAAMDIAREPMKAYLKAAADLIKQYAWAFPAFKRPAGAETARDLDLSDLGEDEMDDILEFAFLRYFEKSGLFGTVDDALGRVAELKAMGVSELACLIDYGIPRQQVMESLEHVATVRARVNGDGIADQSIAGLIERHGVTHLQCTPYMARMLLEADQSRAALGRLRHLLVGGEALPEQLAADLRNETRASIQNMYGPTETTIWSAAATIDGSGITVGKPIANTYCYVLNGAGQPVGIGETGELHIAGAGVARGYWERAELTAERFPPDPFHDGRMFRTGDLARWNEGGTLTILGRADTQVKIRGYRIELGEIEAAMGAIGGVTQAAALIQNESSGMAQIVGYYTGTATPSAIRAALTECLPAFMVPARLIARDRMPLTPNGKIDRKALLQKPLPDAAVPKVRTPPATNSGDGVSIERVGALWARVLGLSSVAPSDNFFDIGGHSLLAIELHRLMKSELGLTGLSIADIFRAPTLGGLHAVIAAKTSAALPEQRDRSEPNSTKTPPETTAATEAMSRRRALRANRPSAS